LKEKQKSILQFKISIMKKINHILEITFSIGASIVILGAYGKIIHASWGGFMLSVGMITEVLLFLASGLILLFDKPVTPTYTALEISDLQKNIASLNKTLAVVKVDGYDLQYEFASLSENLSEANRLLSRITKAARG
jgi:hypothetical protein